jgi:alcohol dehydrogenase class IV
MRANLLALRRTGTTGATSRYDEVARCLTGSSLARADDGIRWVSELVGDVGIPGLGTHGVTDSVVGEVVEAARRASSMKGNPVALSPEELAAILSDAM